jgi:hypothetical protein
MYYKMTSRHVSVGSSHSAVRVFYDSTHTITGVNVPTQKIVGLDK